MSDFKDLLGRTISKIVGAVGDDTMTFTLDDGTEYQLYHERECCEQVTINEIHGDISDLLESPILFAEESGNKGSEGDRPNEDSDSWTWTFYRIGTIKGSVVIRWLGESNGYYSEGVSFRRLS